MFLSENWRSYNILKIIFFKGYNLQNRTDPDQKLQRFEFIVLVNGTSGYATASITFISYWTLLIAHWNPLKDSREVTCMLMNANMKTPKTDKLPGVNISLLAKQMCIISKLRRKSLRFQTTNVRPGQLLNYLVGKWLVEHEINAWKYAFWIDNRKHKILN